MRTSAGGRSIARPAPARKVTVYDVQLHVKGSWVSHGAHYDRDRAATQARGYRHNYPTTKVRVRALKVTA